MQCAFITKKQDFLQLRIDGVNESFVSALRRIAQADIPTLAIDHVEFIVNDTSYEASYLTHRLGLLPIDSRRAQLYYQSECTKCLCLDDACSRCNPRSTNTRKHVCSRHCGACSVEYTLDICNQAPLPSTQQLQYTHSALQAQDARFPIVCLNEAVIEAARYFGLPLEPPERFEFKLLSLGPQQRLKLRAFARKGIGAAGAKWSACKAWFDNEPVLEKPTSGKAALERCPNGAYVYDNDIEDFTQLDVLKCTRCGICEDPRVHKGSADQSIRVSEREQTFSLYIESRGQLPAPDILLQSSEILVEKLRVLQEAFAASI